MRTRIATVLALAIALAAAPALATNGYFAHGYGTPYVGMAGAGVALPLNTLAVATNPAALAFLEPGYDLGLGFFSPHREYTVTGNPSGYPGTFGLAPGNVKSDTELFLMPNLGGAWKLTDKAMAGVAIYGNGGMDTDYRSATFGFNPTGIDLAQMFIAPTAAAKIAEHHALGISVIAAYQRFESHGLYAFAGFSSNPAALSDTGHSSSWGTGARIGYMGELTPWLSVGASYQTRIWMGRFDGYSGLFAEKGGFDIPSNWTAGVTLKPATGLDVALDVQEIYYSEVKSVGNPMLPNLMTARLGDPNGPGFGWRDMTVYKLGVNYAVSPSLTVRAGYSYGRQPVPESEVLFNILAPGVVEQHVTAGASAKIGKKTTLHVGLMYAPSKSVAGPNPLEAPGQQRIELKMSELYGELGLSFGF